MNDMYSEIAMVQKGITPLESAVRTIVTKEIVPNEVYMGKRSFGKENQNVVIETRECDSEKSLDNILKTILSKREKAKELRNIAFNSFYYDDSKRIYIVSISPNATLNDVLSKCPFSVQEKGLLALDLCNEVKKIHDSSDVHNGLSLERVLVSDRAFIILTNYFNSIPLSVRDFLPRELIEYDKDMQVSFPETRYEAESIDVFETALMIYQIFTGKKPGHLQEYKLTDEERNALRQSLRIAPGSFGKCFGPFGDIDFNKKKAGDYLSVFPKALWALVSSAKLCGSYMVERVSKNKVEEYLNMVLDKTSLEENFGIKEHGKSPGGENKKKYVFPFLKKNAGTWYSRNGGRLNYVPVLGGYFGFIKKPEDRVFCPKLDELIKRLSVFEAKKGRDYYGRLYDLIGEKKGKNILNEMTELHVKQKKEHVRNEKTSRLKKAALASTIISVVGILLFAGYLNYTPQPLIVKVDSYIADVADIVMGKFKKKETIDGIVNAIHVTQIRLYIKREDAKTYTVQRSKSARIDLPYLKFAILDSLNASTHISPDTLAFFKVKSLDKKFIVEYSNKLLLSANGHKLKPGLYPVKIEAYNPECKSLSTTIMIKVTKEPVIPVNATMQPSAVKTTMQPSEMQPPPPPPPAIRPTASLLCSGVYKLEHMEAGAILDDVWHTEKERFVDEGGTIYIYRQSSNDIIAANPKEGTNSYFTKEYILSKPLPVRVSNDDIISHSRPLLEKCLKSNKILNRK